MWNVLLYVKNTEYSDNEKVSVKSLNSGIIRLREKYLTDNHFQDLVTTEDILFSSSSAAADFVLGYSVSGPKTWKANDGRSLKEVEASKSDS